MESRPVILLSGISKTFHGSSGNVVALDRLSLSLAAGEFLALTGRSGSGKSTLLNILGLLDVPDSGSYRLLDRELVGASERDLTALRRGTIGFVFQAFSLLPELTVLENVELPLTGLGFGARERQSRARELLELVGLYEQGQRRPRELSGGQQQRAAIARAVVAEPRLVVADEPTGSLDADGEAEVMELFATLAGLGTTIVMATHSHMSAQFCNRQVEIVAGRIVVPPAIGAGAT